MVAQRTFYIHGTFPLHKRIFIVEKKGLQTKKKYIYFENGLFFGKPEWFFYGITAKKKQKTTLFGIFKLINTS